MGLGGAYLFPALLLLREVVSLRSMRRPGSLRRRDLEAVRLGLRGLVQLRAGGQDVFHQAIQLGLLLGLHAFADSQDIVYRKLLVYEEGLGFFAGMTKVSLLGFPIRH